ncbi:unnamed protein product [Cuscuta campestris]|uniref:Uncharacterized protein n=1 Tax=Cuscuta campestris TaxID=132261 RepID=A0A484N3G0_9ASTE|nr:unnamed protein product [Cuscuta campestris]
MKQCMPLDVENWGHTHADKKWKYFMKLKELFKLPEGRHVEKTIKRRANTWYRKWRYDLRKKAYSDHPTVAGRLANCPSEVDPEEWKWLVTYWDREKFRRRSETNKNNQKSQTMFSKVGTKSIASSFYDMLQAKKPDSDECDEENLSETEEVEEEPYYLALWEITKKRKNGTWSDEYAEKAYDDLKALHQEQLDKYGEDNLTPQEALEIVLKHKKGSIHQRGMGQGVLSFHSYVKKDITKVLEQERIDTEVNKRAFEINDWLLYHVQRASSNSSQHVHFTSKDHSPLE